jgi:puromycin-sensitive aminopeptidase
MWFGDLVTMKWWNGIWLNEAFATFMELTTVNDLRPEWEIWVTFGVGRAAAMVTDGLRNTRPVEFPVGRPEEAEAMFDVLTYQKGAAVLRMLEQYLGPEPFRKGIVGYLDEHRHGNTETTDLWDAIEAASGEPARAVMDSWIFQGGYPLVSIRLGEDNRVQLSQRRFLYSGGESDERWQVPLNLRYSTNGTVSRTRLLLADTAAAVELPGQVDWIVVNDGAWGFYRVRYEPPLLQRLTEVMRQELGPLERLSLVSDTWASVLAGHSALTHFLDMVVLLREETDPDVWAAVLGPLGLLDRIISDDDRPVLQAFVRRVVGHAFERLSWDPSPGESERAGTLRGRLLLALGTLGADPQVQAEAGRRHAAYLEDRSSLAPDLVTATVTVVAYAGGEDVFDTMLQQFRTATTPQNEMRYLFSLAAPQEPDLLGQALDLSLTSEVRTQDAPYLIGSVLASRAGSRLGWAFLEEHWETIIRRFPENTVPRMIEGITSITDAGLAHQIHRFLDAHPTSHEQLVAQSRERLDSNVAFATRLAGQLPDMLRTK